jgi:hypothetical protein
VDRLHSQNDGERQVAFDTLSRLRFGLMLRFRRTEILVHLFHRISFMKRDGPYRHVGPPGRGRILRSIHSLDEVRAITMFNFEQLRSSMILALKNLQKGLR